MTRIGRWTPVVAGATLLLAVAALILALGYPLPGPWEAVGLFLLGAVPAWSMVRLGLRAPAAVVGVGLLAAVVVELVLPGPWIAALGPDRLTSGTTVLANFAASWPLWLLVALLAGLGERVLRQRPDVRRGWAAALVVGVVCGVGTAGLVLLAGVPRGWLTTPHLGLAFGLPAMAVLGFLAGVVLWRWRLATPWVTLLVAVSVAAVASLVATAGDPAAGMVNAALPYLALALLLLAAELLVRLAVRGVRRLRRTVLTPR